MAYKSYLDDKYGNMDADYSQQSFSPETQSMATPAASGDMASSAAGSGATGAAMASGNPYAMAGSFLVNMMAAKRKAFEDRKAKEMAMAQNYEKTQNAGLQNLGDQWKSAFQLMK